MAHVLRQSGAGLVAVLCCAATVLCVPIEPLKALPGGRPRCPLGYSLYDGDGSGCGILGSCDRPFSTETVDACRTQCDWTASCRSFSWKWESHVCALYIDKRPTKHLGEGISTLKQIYCTNDVFAGSEAQYEAEEKTRRQSDEEARRAKQKTEEKIRHQAYEKNAKSEAIQREMKAEEDKERPQKDAEEKDQQLKMQVDGKDAKQELERQQKKAEQQNKQEIERKATHDTAVEKDAKNAAEKERPHKQAKQIAEQQDKLDAERKVKQEAAVEKDLKKVAEAKRQAERKIKQETAAKKEAKLEEEKARQEKQAKQIAEEQNKRDAERKVKQDAAVEKDLKKVAEAKQQAERKIKQETAVEMDVKNADERARQEKQAKQKAEEQSKRDAVGYVNQETTTGTDAKVPEEREGEPPEVQKKTEYDAKTAAIIKNARQTSEELRMARAKALHAQESERHTKKSEEATKIAKSAKHLEKALNSTETEIAANIDKARREEEAAKKSKQPKSNDPDIAAQIERAQRGFERLSKSEGAAKKVEGHTRLEQSTPALKKEKDASRMTEEMPKRVDRNTSTEFKAMRQAVHESKWDAEVAAIITKAQQQSKILAEAQRQRAMSQKKKEAERSTQVVVEIFQNKAEQQGVLAVELAPTQDAEMPSEVAEETQNDSKNENTCRLANLPKTGAAAESAEAATQNESKLWDAKASRMTEEMPKRVDRNKSMELKAMRQAVHESKWDAEVAAIIAKAQQESKILAETQRQRAVNQKKKEIERSTQGVVETVRNETEQHDRSAVEPAPAQEVESPTEVVEGTPSHTKNGKNGSFVNEPKTGAAAETAESATRNDSNMWSVVETPGAATQKESKIMESAQVATQYESSMGTVVESAKAAAKNESNKGTALVPADAASLNEPKIGSAGLAAEPSTQENETASRTSNGRDGNDADSSGAAEKAANDENDADTSGATTRSKLASQRVKFTAQGMGSIPRVAIDTSRIKNETELVAALDSGYRHIDTAWINGNLAVVGEALRQSGLKQEDVFITTKVGYLPDLTPPSRFLVDLYLRGFSGAGHSKLAAKGTVRAALRQSMRELRLSQMSLCLLHTPVVGGLAEFLAAIPPSESHFEKPLSGAATFLSQTVAATARRLSNVCGYLVGDVCGPMTSTAAAQARQHAWEDLEAAWVAGECRHIGVSNFDVPLLRELERNSKVTPAVNQIEHHLKFQAGDTIAYCKERGIAVMSYGHEVVADVLQENVSEAQVVQLVALQENVSEAQVSVAWALRDEEVAVVAPSDALPTSDLAFSHVQMHQLETIGQARPFYWNLGAVATADAE